MNCGDSDGQHFLPNVTDEIADQERRLHAPPELDGNVFHPHHHAGDAFGQPSLIELGAHQYPLTPLEGSLPGSHTPFSGLSPPTFPPTGSRKASQTDPQLLAQNTWVGSLPQQPAGLVDGQFADMSLGFMPTSEPRGSFDIGYFPLVGSGPSLPASSPTGDVPASPWRPYAPTATFLAVPVDQQDVRAVGGGSAQPDKVKRKRGRPRLYEDDGTQRPRRKPGRPPTYVVGNERGSSSSSRFQSFQSTSSTSDSSSTAGSSWPATLASEPSTSSTVSSSGKGKGKELPQSIAEGDEAEQDEDDEEEARKQATIRARNKTAASRYRAKTQLAISMMEAEEQSVSERRQELISCVTQLREEVFYLKNEVLRQANCGCPLIAGYLAEAARLAYGPNTPQGPMRTGSISSGMEGMVLSGDDSHVAHVEGCTGGLGPTGGDSQDGGFV